MNRVALLVEKGQLTANEFEIVGQSTTIGSAAVNDIRIAEPGIERVHAEIRRVNGDDCSIAPLADGVRVNGRAIAAPTALKPGDRIAVGRAHVFRLQATGAQTTARRTAVSMPMRLPPWLIAYLAVMGLLFGYLAVSSSSAGDSLPSIVSAERAYADAHRLPPEQTAEVVRLLTLAAVHERRGDTSTAYEVYRDVLAARTPPAPRSPAYLFAANRMVVVRPR